MASNVAVPAAECLKALTTLVEVHEKVLDSHYFSRVQLLPNEEVREVLLDIAMRTAHQSNQLHLVLARWRAAMSAPRPVENASEEAPTLRDIVTSWIEIKAGSAQIYRSAASSAPSKELSTALLALADEDEKFLASLKELL